MSLILDAGAFLAVERGDRELLSLLKQELRARRSVRSHGGVVAQVWRGGRGRQARLAPLLSAIAVQPLDEALGRRAGELLGRAGMTDAIDAAVVLLAVDGDVILTSDPDDLGRLAATAGLLVELVPV